MSDGRKCCREILGLIDSLQVFKKLFPSGSLKQEDLVARLLGVSYNAHNAMADVESLRQLILLPSVANLQLAFSFSPTDVHSSMMFDREKKNLPSLNILLSSGVCKLPTAENIAGSGLNLHHLRAIFRRCGEDGLRDVFTAKNSDNLPRVTSAKKILDEVIPKLAAFFEK